MSPAIIVYYLNEKNEDYIQTTCISSDHVQNTCEVSKESI